MTQVEFYCGTHRSDRAAAIDTLVAQYWGRALLITPTHALASRRMEALLLGGTLPGAFGAPVREFTRFAENMLAAGGSRPRMLESLDRLLLMEGCLAEMAAERAEDDTGPDPAAPGWPRHLLDVITELKQAAIEPEEFAARVKALKNPGPFDELVAGAYARYQQALLNAGAYDVPGLYWEARALCESGAPGILAGLELVAFDGFDDFTPSQMRFITALAPHVPHLVIGLNYDMEPGRRDLFELPARAYARLRTALEAQGGTIIETRTLRTSDSANWAQHAADHLVPRDRTPIPDKLEDNVRLVPCLDGQHELETVARAIKRHILDDGVAPGRIAVAFREFGAMAGPLREVFREFGIPCRVRHRTPLRESAAGAFLLRLLEAVNGWQRAAVVELMASPWFQPEGPPGPLDAAPMLAREANHVAGRGEWFGGVDWLEKRLDRHGDADDDEPGRLPLPDPKAALASLKARSQILAQLDDTLLKTASMKVHAAALAGVMVKCRLERGLESLGDERHRRAEQDALLALGRVVETLYDADRTGEEISHSEFVGMLSRAMDCETFAWPDDRAGVWCGEATRLRHEAFDHVYYCGANEGVAPRPPSSNAVYPQTDVERLCAAGVELSGAVEHASLERLLFHHALCAAEKTFTVTWRMQGADGREALPGAFVAELRDLLGDHTVAPRPRADGLVPAPGEAACLRDVANAWALGGNARLERGFAADFAGIGELLALERRRHSAEDYDNFDGVLADLDTRAWVAERFGEKHQFSVSQIEKHIGCPFTFFVRHVLGIEDLREPAEELEPLERGTLFHDALRRLLETQRGKSAAALLEEHGEEDLATLLDGVLREAFNAKAGRLAPVPVPLLDAERARMAKQLVRFMKRTAELLGDAYRFAHAEAAFGTARGPRSATLHVPEPFIFEHAGLRALFSGKIDRIDAKEGGYVRIVDYKTGAVPANKDIYEGNDLQLSVYQWVVPQLLPGTVCDEAWYCSLTQKQDADAVGKSATRMKDKWAQRENAAREQITGAVTGIRAGCFPPEPRNRKRPDCPDAGRFQAARIARKQAAAGRAAYDLREDSGGDES